MVAVTAISFSQYRHNSRVRKELGKKKHTFCLIPPPIPRSLLYLLIINCRIVSLDFDYPMRSWRVVRVDDWGAEVPQAFDVYHWHRRRREVRSLSLLER